MKKSKDTILNHLLPYIDSESRIRVLNHMAEVGTKNYLKAMGYKEDDYTISVKSVELEGDSIRTYVYVEREEMSPFMRLTIINEEEKS